jgi:energy-coupling factor transport system ATP-binding protein
VPFTVDEMMNAINDRKPSRILRREESVQGGEEIIRADGLDFWYDDGTHALKNISFSIKEGEFVGLIGQNGAGKTTISRIIAGIYRKYKGSIRIAGQDLRERKVVERIPEYVGYVFQNPDHQIFMRTVHDEVVYGLRNTRVPESEAEERAREALAAVGLGGKIDEDPLFLGKGEKRRLTVASILAMRPRVMIVDEPTTGQDHRMSEDIMQLLAKLNHGGTTIVVITHDMTLVSEHTKRVIVMYHGGVIYDGATRGFFADQDLLEKAAIIPPLAVRLSHAYVEKHQGAEFLMNAEEWVQAISHRGSV